MRRLLVACAVLASACQPDENIPEAAPATTEAPAINTTALAPEPSTTTTEPEPTTTLAPEPILCPSLDHPAHHNPCPVATTLAVPRQQSPTATTEVIAASGEWAIPTYIVMCESGGDWYAHNPSGASGPYQLMPMHFGGELAMNQSRAAQHAKAAELWAGGAGRSHWAACL